jgi:rhodanese-related sulfurtransferase
MIQEIAPDEVFKAIQSKDDFILLDVRTKEEYSRNRLEGAVNVPLDSITGAINAIASDKSKKIFVYCLSGSRSEVAAEILSKYGYTNVFNMKSGLLLWRVKRFAEDTTPLLDKAKP